MQYPLAPFNHVVIAFISKSFPTKEKSCSVLSDPLLKRNAGPEYAERNFLKLKARLALGTLSTGNNDIAMAAVTVIVPVALTLLQPPVNGIE